MIGGASEEALEAAPPLAEEAEEAEEAEGASDGTFSGFCSTGETGVGYGGKGLTSGIDLTELDPGLRQTQPAKETGTVALETEEPLEMYSDSASNSTITSESSLFSNASSSSSSVSSSSRSALRKRPRGLLKLG